MGSNDSLATAKHWMPCWPAEVNAVNVLPVVTPVHDTVLFHSPAAIEAVPNASTILEKPGNNGNNKSAYR